MASLVRLEYLAKNSFGTWCRTGYNNVYSVQPILFILFTKSSRTPPLRNQLFVLKIKQEINEPSYEMVGVKITVPVYGQNNPILVIFILVDFVSSSLTTPNGVIVMVLKCTY